MLTEIPYVGLIIGVVSAGLWLSNKVYDQKTPQYVSRKIGHAAGGLAYFIAVFTFQSAVWPLILCFSFGLLLWLARVRRPQTFRGVGGSGRDQHVMAEVWFAWIAVPVFAVGWLWLDQPLLTASALLFMAWGDCITGLIRAGVYKKAVKGLWGSFGMLVVCLGISWALIEPFWIGALGSVAAAVVEWAFGDTGSVKWADDNWAIPVVSLTFMLGLSAMSGNL
jgi:phytol kinase